MYQITILIEYLKFRWIVFGVFLGDFTEYFSILWFGREMIIEMIFKKGFRLIVNSFVFVAMNLLKSSPFFPALLGQKQATQPDLGNLMVVYEYTVHQGRTRLTHWGQKNF